MTSMLIGTSSHHLWHENAVLCLLVGPPLRLGTRDVDSDPDENLHHDLVSDLDITSDSDDD